MSSDQRKEIRSAVTQQPHGKLQVLFGEQAIEVDTVKDVSPTGIRLKVGTQIEIGQNIRVRYLTEKIDLKLNGTVVWNSTLGGNTDEILIGIKLTSPSLLQTLW